ncbi:MAG: murein L,D-transpeptidase catalytic domain family protein [Ginsengibacter sp.]
MNKSLKKFFIFFSPLFIFLIHLLFVFAKTKPHTQSAPGFSQASSASPVSDNNGEESPNSNKSAVYDSLHLNILGLTKQAFDYAIKGFNSLRSMGRLNNDSIISIIDFSLSSGKKRLFVIDIKNYKVLYNTYVAHGRNSGDEYAKEFSNDPESFKSSLGFYVTQDTYRGEHGFSLHLEGEEKGINDNAYSRAIVMHCAPYVNEKYARSKGYIGRSLGCPALPQKIYKPIIEKIKNGSCLFLYSPDTYYLSHSAFLQQAS